MLGCVIVSMWVGLRGHVGWAFVDVRLKKKGESVEQEKKNNKKRGKEEESSEESEGGPTHEARLPPAQHAPRPAPRSGSARGAAGDGGSARAVSSRTAFVVSASGNGGPSLRRTSNLRPSVRRVSVLYWLHPSVRSPPPPTMTPLCRLSCSVLPLLLLLLPAVRASFARGAAADCGPGHTSACPDQKKSDLRVCDAGTCRFGGTCRENGADIKCVCAFHCHKKYTPVCASNGDTYQNECFLRRAACKKQRAISLVSEGPCYHDAGSGSGGGDDEGSGRGKKVSKCGNCRFGAECDEDSEDLLCMCNIVCNGHNDNPVCGADGNTYDTPCHVREASCLKQLKIDIRHVGRCQERNRKDDGGKNKPDVHAVLKPGEGDGLEVSPTPCPEDYAHFCEHGECEMRYNLPTCRCESAYGGPHCDQLLDFNVLYVVPSGQKLHYVLIAAIIGAVQITAIVAVVMCFTRRCNKTKRGRRQKQHLPHFSSGTSSRMM